MPREHLIFPLAAALFLVLASPSSGTTHVYVPLATRVERSDLVVIGRVIADRVNKHKKEKDCGPNEATLLVKEVVRGKLVSTRTTTLPDGARGQTILLRHWEDMSTETGNFSDISRDERYKSETNGIWLLNGSDVSGTYCISYPHAVRLDELENVRKTINMLDSNYEGAKPGFPVDDRTWVSSFGAPESGTHASVCVQEDGSIFVEGVFRGELAVSGHPLLNAPSWDHFLAHLGPDGTVRWARALGSEQRFDAKPIAGIGGTVLLVGQTNQPCSVLGVNMPWSGGGPLIVSVSSTGRVEWTQTIDSRVFASTDPGLFRTTPQPGRVGISRFIAVRHASGYRIVGTFSGDIVAGERQIAADKDSDWFAAELDSGGKIRNITLVKRVGAEEIYRIAAAPNHRMIVGGGVRVPSRKFDAFVSAITPNGKTLWTATEGGPKDDGVVDLAVDTRGTVVATMQILRDAYPSQQIWMYAWNSKGERLWRVSGGGFDIEIGTDGNIYCVGAYGHSFMVPEKDMPAPMGDTDLFLACFDQSGKRLWVMRDGGLSGDHAASLHLLPDGRAVVGGWLDGSSFLAGHAIKQRGWMDAFVMNIPLPKVK